MIRVVWSDRSLDDVQSIRDYIARDAPVRSQQFIERLMQNVDR